MFQSPGGGSSHVPQLIHILDLPKSDLASPLFAVLPPVYDVYMATALHHDSSVDVTIYTLAQGDDSYDTSNLALLSFPSSFQRHTFSYRTRESPQVYIYVAQSGRLILLGLPGAIKLIIFDPNVSSPFSIHNLELPPSLSGPEAPVFKILCLDEYLGLVYITLEGEHAIIDLRYV